MSTTKESESLPLLSDNAQKPKGLVARFRSLEEESVGYLYMLFAACCFSIHAFCIRLSESTYSVPFTVNLLSRGLIHVTGSCIYFIATTRPLSTLFDSPLSRRQLLLLALRGFVGTVALLTFYLSIGLLPIGSAISVFFLNTVFTAMMSRIFLNETVQTTDLLAIALSAVGTSLIAFTQGSDGSSLTLLGVALIAVAALLASFAYTIIRHLGMTINFMSSVLAFSSFCVLASIPLRAPQALYEMLSNPEHRNALLPVGSAGLISFVAQCALNLGLQRARAGPAVLITNIEVPITFLLGYLFLGEKPGWLTALGSLCIVGATLTIGIMKLPQFRN